MPGRRRSGSRGNERMVRGGTVTALVAVGRSAERMVVHVDGKPAFDLVAEIVESEGLRVGSELSEEEAERLSKLDEPYRARAAAVAMLGRREFCASEVGKRLRTSGFSDAAAAGTIEWLQAHDLVDDRRFVALYAEEKSRGGWGRRRIVAELLSKGVDRECLTSDTWRELGLERTTEETAGFLATEVERRFGERLRSEPLACKRRIEGFLARRGHDRETIKEVLRLVVERGDEVYEVEGP